MSSLNVRRRIRVSASSGGGKSTVKCRVCLLFRTLKIRIHTAPVRGRFNPRWSINIMRTVNRRRVDMGERAPSGRHFSNDSASRGLIVSICKLREKPPENGSLFNYGFPDSL